MTFCHIRCIMPRSQTASERDAPYEPRDIQHLQGGMSGTNFALERANATFAPQTGGGLLKEETRWRSPAF